MNDYMLNQCINLSIFSDAKRNVHVSTKQERVSNRKKIMAGANVACMF